MRQPTVFERKAKKFDNFILKSSWKKVQKLQKTRDYFWYAFFGFARVYFIKKSEIKKCLLEKKFLLEVQKKIGAGN